MLSQELCRQACLLRERAVLGCLLPACRSGSWRAPPVETKYDIAVPIVFPIRICVSLHATRISDLGGRLSLDEDNSSFAHKEESSALLAGKKSLD